MAKLDVQSTRESLRTQLWPVPVFFIAIAVTLGQLLPHIDRITDDSLPPAVSGVLFGGDPEAARSMLETIAGSLITVTSLTFSLTVVTLQLASSQFSPRLLRTFTQDRFVHNTLALFLATFVYSLTVLRSIRVETSEGDGFVPEISVTVAFLLTVASVVGLILFLAHLTRQIRVETMLKNVHSDTTTTLARVYSEKRQTQNGHPVPQTQSWPLKAQASGFVTRIDDKALAAAAQRSQCFISVDIAPGTSIISGLPIARAWPIENTTVDRDQLQHLEKALHQGIKIGFERTSTQDPSFGLQQLLDVTDKALSPGINDPTTAVHALGHISAVLCYLTTRITGPKSITDDHGSPRLRVELPSFVDLLQLTMDQLLTYAFTDPRTAERTINMLGEIKESFTENSLSAHKAAVQNELIRVKKTVSSSTLENNIQQRLTTRISQI
ncbi:DUF2254 domain-containing protein [Jonesia quinghaiensis]|uniref:DUF2254 domain-containing protein n=1 Tax=Jonesia quinghaiensis TaxID=262806 RepID=UPI00041DDDBB|nr:DUF2254 domain-containing protein [Jonesia quinghaiensis]